MVIQQLVHSKPSLPASIHKDADASLDSRSNGSLTSAAEMEAPEPMERSKGDRAGVSGVLQQLEIVAKPQPHRMAVKAKGKIFFIEISDIFAVHAEANYASLKYQSGAYLLRESLSSIAVKLKPYGFIQIHRSVLVNASLVDEVWSLSTGEYGLRVRNGKEYVVTRRYKDNLRDLAYVWLGSDRF
jgi:DNA-binding LytR/AlgR family response regulator